MAKHASLEINLAAAMALLVRNQAAYVESMRGSEERFARIERDLEEIKRMLLRHERILRELPEVLRQKVGFRQQP